MKYIFLFVSFVFLSSMYSQGIQNTFWGGIGLRTSVTKNFRIDLEQQLREENAFSDFKNTFSELALNYKLKKFKFNSSYRYMIWNRGVRHRFAADVYYKQSLIKKKVGLLFRERLQEFTWQDDKSKNTNIRSLLMIEYGLKKLGKLFLGNELFFQLNGINKFQNYRLSFGANWKLLNHINLMTYYNMQTSINSSLTSINHMFVLRAFYKINPFTKTKN